MCIRDIADLDHETFVGSERPRGQVDLDRRVATERDELCLVRVDRQRVDMSLESRRPVAVVARGILYELRRALQRARDRVETDLVVDDRAVAESLERELDVAVARRLDRA